MNPSPYRIALCQLDAHVGDVTRNLSAATEAVQRAADVGAHLALFPECFISGYPAEDLWLSRQFVAECESAVDSLAATAPIPVIIGSPRIVNGRVRNAAAAIADGTIIGWYDKRELPNYGVFDEHRWFEAGDHALVVPIAGRRVGITICEDLWVGASVFDETVAAGADLVVNLSASPYRMDRFSDRADLLARLAVRGMVPIALCNLVGGQDELVFDGSSIVTDGRGELCVSGPHCAAAVTLADIVDSTVTEVEDAERPASIHAEVWDALTLGLADYVSKNGFGDVVVGVSGGIDSALVLALAVDAIGASRVHAVTMPSTVTSDETLSDAHELARMCGVRIQEHPIEPIMSTFLQELASDLAGRGPDTTEENLQARIRGTLLMTLSNRYGWIVLTTGNKSEVAVGYSTLYGDTAGGFAPIRDVPKTLVWQLARWRNEVAVQRGEQPPIPASTIDRPPTAELRPGQRDDDSLPPYETLDPILVELVERGRSVAEVSADGHDVEVVGRIARMVDAAEYKRRQAPPGIRVTSRAFGRERRMPITNAYRGSD